VTERRHELTPEQEAELQRRFEVRGRVHRVLQELELEVVDWESVIDLLRWALETAEVAQ
jgi:hypothetical protein